MARRRTIPWTKTETQGDETASLLSLLVLHYNGNFDMDSLLPYHRIPELQEAEKKFRAAAHAWFPGAITDATKFAKLLGMFKRTAKQCVCDESWTM